MRPSNADEQTKTTSFLKMKQGLQLKTKQDSSDRGIGHW